MGLKLLEGFDHFTGGATTLGAWPTLLATKNWNYAIDSGVAAWSQLAAGRVNGRCLQMGTMTGGLSGSERLWKNISSNLTELHFGIAIDFSNFFGDYPIKLRTLGGGNVLSLGFSGGFLTLVNASGTGLIVSTTPISTNVWHHVEVYLKISGTTWTVATAIDGGPDIPATVFTGQANTNVASVWFEMDRSIVFSGNAYSFDDVCLNDSAGVGGAPADFLGDLHVTTLYPRADGTHQQWTPNSGSAHFSRLNEHSPDDDTSYVSDNTLGHRDSYPLDSLTGVGAIRGIQVNQYARKFDSGYRQLAPIIRRSGTTYSGTVQALSTSYVDKTQIYDSDPSTSAAWTVAGINAGEFGSEVA